MDTFAPPAGFEVENNGGPFTELAGPLYRQVGRADGKIVKGFRVEPRHANRNAVVHGGMLCTFLDNLFGTSAEAAAGSAALVTVTLTTQFLSAARVGDWVEGEAEVTRAGRRLVFLRASVRTADRIVMTGEACFARVDRG